MKRLISIAGFILVCSASSVFAASQVWIASGPISNPTSGQILADTGPLATNLHAVCWDVAADGSATISFQRVDSTGTVISEQWMVVDKATASRCTLPSGINVNTNAGDHLRLIAPFALHGTVSASLWIDQTP